jgi:DNA-binding GntR family transcriptional regulator
MHEERLSMASAEQHPILTNSERELARILERSGRTNPRVTAIAQAIGCAIIEGHLQPGADLNTVDLAQQFHTSRTPVKEALLLLENKGLVTFPAYRRPFVAQLSLEEVREIYQVRAQLLMLVAELIVKTTSDAAIASLRTILLPMRAMANAHDVDGVFWANAARRTREAEICGNKQVQRMLDSLGLRTLQLRHLSMKVGDPQAEQRLGDRERLVSAYEDRDAPLATALTRTMVLRALAILEESKLFRSTKEGGEGA